MRKILSLIIGLLPTMFFIGTVAADGMLSSMPLPPSGKTSWNPPKTMIVTPVTPMVTETEEEPLTISPSSIASPVAIPYPSWIGGFGNGPRDRGMGEEFPGTRPVQRVPTCGCAQPLSHDRPSRRSIIKAFYQRMQVRIAALIG